MEIINKDFKGTINTINKELRVDKSFDLIYRTFKIDDKKASLYFIDGFAKDDIFQKLMQYFMDMNNEDNIDNYYDFLKTKLPYIEVDVCDELEKLKLNVLSGVIALVIEGYERIILIDARTYPMRSIEEPTKDKVFRGSKDGFVETLVSNTALIRRRIRDINLTFEIYTVGRISKTDVVVAYMNNKVDKKLLSNIKEKLNSIKVDSLSMNQESLAECLYKGKWFNPFPKFQYTERPDTSASAIMEGHIVILVDNSPSAMIIPVSFFDILEEADDYYFPPITGTYFRFTRVIVTLVALFLTPVYLLFAYGYVDTPKWLEFIIIKDTINVPILAQLLILEVAIDGMKLAAVNTPDMLNTPLSIIIGVVLGDAAVSSCWFNNEIMLYMAFVAFANFTHGSFELGYALKFLRIFLLLTTSIFGLWGFIGGVIIILLLVAFNKTVSNESYIYPLIPFNGKKLINIFIRRSKNHMNN